MPGVYVQINIRPREKSSNYRFHQAMVSEETSAVSTRAARREGSQSYPHRYRGVWQKKRARNLETERPRQGKN